MGWPTDAEVTAASGVVLRPGSATPTPTWLPDTVATSNAAAKTEIQAALAGRGYTPEQIDTWAAGPGHSICTEQALFFVACKIVLDVEKAESIRGTGHSYLDRRKELRDGTLTITDAAGNLILPLGGAGKSVGTGTLKAASDYARGRVHRQGLTYPSCNPPSW